MQQHLLSLIVFLPLASACIMLFLPREGYDRFRIITLLFNALNMALLGLLAYAHAHGFSAEINTSWFSIASGNGTVFSANYHLRTDGLSLPLLLLTGVVMFMATLASDGIREQVKGYYILMQVLNTAILGSFAAADMLLFYLFFEFMLVPMYFLIGIWGSTRREYAAVKF